jgi:hypothetical protein
MFVTSVSEPVQLALYEDNTLTNEQLLDSAIALVQSYGFQKVSGELACLSCTTEVATNLAKQAQVWQATIIYVPSPHLGQLFSKVIDIGSSPQVRKRKLWEGFLHNFARLASPTDLKKPVINPLISLALLDVQGLLQLTMLPVVLTEACGVAMRLTHQKAIQPLLIADAGLESPVLNVAALAGGGEWVEIPTVKQIK